MAFNGNFTVTPNTSVISKFTLTDTSSGTDSNLTGRRVYLYKTDGTTIVPSGTSTEYIVWAIANSTMEIDVLDKDYAISIVVIWVSSAPLSPPSEYTKTVITDFNAPYSNTFWYGLIQQMAANSFVYADNNFATNLGKLVTDIDNSTQSVVYSDQYSAQAALDRVYNMIVNQSTYF